MPFLIRTSCRIVREGDWLSPNYEESIGKETTKESLCACSDHILAVLSGPFIVERTVNTINGKVPATFAIGTDYVLYTKYRPV